MKIVFVSNYFNHHQKPISDVLFAQLGNNYSFIQTQNMTDERINMGWSIEKLPPYVKKINEENKKVLCKEIDEADVTIFGSANEELIKNRINENKIIIRYSERPLKNGFEPLKYFPRLIKWHKLFPNNKKIYLFCASAYAYDDYSKFFLFKNKAYKWGYFPEFRNYDSISDIFSKKEPNSIIWVSRMIKYKHPEIPILVAKKLKDSGINFKMTLIGNGNLEENVRKKISELKLDDEVKIISSLSPKQVRDEMEKSQIFLFTSDRGEGWGAVLNEAMNSCCACVANKDIGAAPYLIDDGENGFLFKKNNVQDISEIILNLFQNNETRTKISENAYFKIKNEWSPEVGGQRLIEMCQALLDSREIKYKSGPCSKIKE